MSQIIIDGVSKSFPNGVKALLPTSLTIDRGSFVAILGPSGAGKSTLLRCINGLEKPTTGTVSVDGIQVTESHYRAVRSRVAMIFQQFNLVHRLQVMTNVLTGRLAHRSWIGSTFHLFRQSDLHIAHESLARVGLVDKTWHRSDRLSGGQQQRVGIARALAQRPHVILADEPVASLDPVASVEVMEILQSICRNDGITILVNLHQVDLAMRYADRIIGLNAGKLMFDGPPATLLPEVQRRLYERTAQESDECCRAVG